MVIHANDVVKGKRSQYGNLLLRYLWKDRLFLFIIKKKGKTGCFLVQEILVYAPAMQQTSEFH